MYVFIQYNIYLNSTVSVQKMLILLLSFLVFKYFDCYMNVLMYTKYIILINSWYCMYVSHTVDTNTELYFLFRLCNMFKYILSRTWKWFNLFFSYKKKIHEIKYIL